MTASTSALFLPAVVGQDLARQRAHQAIRDALAALGAARVALSQAGYLQIRVDQYQHPETRVLVETGYMYGETRLTIHDPLDEQPTDFRLTGYGSHFDKFDRFKELIAA